MKLQNKHNFRVYPNLLKTQMLEWVARKRMTIQVYLAFPYNPYHPKPKEKGPSGGVKVVSEGI